MPECYHKDENGKEFDVTQSYRLCFVGHKHLVKKMEWEPFSKTPLFVQECLSYIQTRPDILKCIEEAQKERAEHKKVVEQKKVDRKEKRLLAKSKANDVFETKKSSADIRARKKLKV